jgi:hypothetical protein
MITRNSEPRIRTKRGLLQAIAIITATIASLVATATAASAAGPTSASTTDASARIRPAAPSAFAPLKNFDNGLCVRPEINGEAQLRMATCNAADLTENWIFVSKSNGSHIVNQLSGLCVYMNGPVITGSPVIQTGCTTVSNEDWQPATAPPAVTTIMSKAGFRNTNLCLSPNSSGLVVIFTCNGSTEQQWVIGVPNV